MSVIKRSWSLIGIVLVLLISIALVRVRAVVHACINQLMAEEICWQYVERLEWVTKKIEKVTRNETLKQVADLIEMGREIRPFRNYLIGEGKKITYLVLLQNDFELRANGGFSGSYAVIEMEKGRWKMRFEDIYTPDGQLNGYVAPPPPIQAAFRKGGYLLRDSDWEPDFPLSATTMRWFFEKGGEVNPDILVTLPFSTVREIIGILGSVKVPEYNLTINNDNIYDFLQSESEVDFFAGSTQKKDAITAVGRAVFGQARHLSWKAKIRLAHLILEELKRQNMVVHSLSDEFEQKLLFLEFGGELKPIRAEDTVVGDTVGLIEVNLGANKANCCLLRQTEHVVSESGEKIKHTIVAWFENKSGKENPSPPDFYGGNYLSFLRFYVPIEASNIKVEAEPTYPNELIGYPLPVDTARKTGEVVETMRFGFKEIGFFHLTKAGTRSRVELSYQLLIGNEVSYQLMIFKQNGVRQSPQVIDIFGKKSVANLENDFTVSEMTENGRP